MSIGGFVVLFKNMDNVVLFDQKWCRFLKRTWPFRFLPFIDFVLAAGSMATGNVRPQSDFDVIVGAQYGRIFTARFFCILALGLLGWRRRRWHATLAKDYLIANKVCLNHFVTERSYRLSPPHNEYWQLLYKKLVPVFGQNQKLNEFFSANADWANERNYIDDLRHDYKTGGFLKAVAERILSGRLGNALERLLRQLQLVKIKAGLSQSAGYKPRLIYTDTELEFHPDTKRIEDFRVIANEAKSD